MRRWIAVLALVQVFTIARIRGIIDGFILKGGFALEARLRGAARSSRDVDIVLPIASDDLLDTVILVLRLNWSGFTFALKGTPKRREHSYTFEVNALYQNTAWATFELELVFGGIGASDDVTAMDLVTLGLQPSAPIPCMTVGEQIAQKLHAVTDPNESRPRDLVDIFLLDTRLPRDDTALVDYCVRTFAERGTHVWPPNVELRDGWGVQINEIVEKLGFDITLEDIVSGVTRLVARLLEVKMAAN